jgi:integrase
LRSVVAAAKVWVDVGLTENLISTGNGFQLGGGKYNVSKNIEGGRLIKGIPFTVKAVNAATAKGKFADGQTRGLYLQISPTGTKSWSFRYRDRITGKLREMGLGPLDVIGLEAARKKATELRAIVQDDRDPIMERKTRRAALRVEHAKALTFDEAAKACIDAKRPGWTNPKHAEQWTSTLASYASPIFGSILVRDIDTGLVLKVLEQEMKTKDGQRISFWAAKNETASRVRQRIEAVLAWATVREFRTGDNPARWKNHLDTLLAKPSAVQTVEHHAALPYLEIHEFMTALHAQEGIGAMALEFAILAAARTGEVIGAKWKEFDLDSALWTIPAARMKANKEHVVPLSPRAIEILTALQKARTNDFVFPGGKAGKPLSNMAMAELLKRMERLDITVHGFRSTFRDWAGETTSFPREVIEHALAHQLKDKAEAAYQRGTLLDKRRKLMAAWAQYCATSKTTGAKVLNMRAV